MRRREFIALLGAAATWPLAARAQQPAMPVMGFLGQTSPDVFAPLVAAFREGLKESGHVEGQNLLIEYRWAQNQLDRLPELAADLVRRGVAVIATPASTPAALAAKGETSTIPIVFSMGGDPVRFGLVAALNRPGGNITGISSFDTLLAAKRLGLLHDLIPTATRVAVLVNPKTQIAEQLIEDAQSAAKALGWPPQILTASTNDEITIAFERLTQNRPDALLVSPDPLFVDRRAQLIGLARTYRVPAIYPFRQDTEAGGLMSYGAGLPDLFRQTGVYTGRVLKGEKPSELPVMRATKFEMVINLKTAKALGLDIPPMLLAIADEVIE
jgi:putative ABC transport system substrate-binding protein